MATHLFILHYIIRTDVAINVLEERGVWKEKLRFGRKVCTGIKQALYFHEQHTEITV